MHAAQNHLVYIRPPEDGLKAGTQKRIRGRFANSLIPDRSFQPPGKLPCVGPMPEVSTFRFMLNEYHWSASPTRLAGDIVDTGNSPVAIKRSARPLSQALLNINNKDGRFHCGDSSLILCSAKVDRTMLADTQTAPLISPARNGTPPSPRAHWAESAPPRPPASQTSRGCAAGSSAPAPRSLCRCPHGCWACRTTGRAGGA